MTHVEISTVLLVTADEARSSFLTDQLEADGFDVVAADDAAMGLRSLERAYPDLVLVDARLPDAPGLSIVGAIRGADAAHSRVDPSTPVMVLTEGDEPIERVRALERGADDALAGPPHYPELLGPVSCLGDKRSRGHFMSLRRLFERPVGASG